VTDLFVPPAATGLPLPALDSATQGADMLDAAARTPYGRNLLAHALVQLARDGWLRTEPGQGFEPLDAAPAAVSPPAVDPTDEERADREATERDHSRGDHTYCGITCETELPTEQLRNFVVAKGYPGTAGALDELLRRAREESRPDPDTRAVRTAALREAADYVGNDDDCDCGGCDTCLPRALAAELRRMADETPQPEPAVHLGGQANAEHCPGCSAERRNLPYPFLCPAAPGDKAQPGKEPAP
jgi:hypothetical protein